LHKLIKSFFKITLIIIVTIAIIEGMLQITFLSLPQAIIQRMPQYQERYGMRLNTSHGAREYPANEQVDFEVNQYSGDLYQISCLSPKDSVEFTPYHVQYTRDSHGFRNVEPWSDGIDLTIIGDSFTAAESVINPYWEALSDNQLVLGVGGSGTLEQAILYEQFAASRSPKTVFLEYYSGNDLIDNITFDIMRRDGMTFADKTHNNRHLLEYSVLFHLGLFIRDMFFNSGKSNCVYPVTAHIEEQSIPLAFFNNFVVMLTVPQDQLHESKAFQITRKSIVDLSNTVTDRDSRFVLIYIPHKAEIYWKYLDPEAQQRIINALPPNPSPDGVIDGDLVSANLEAQRNLIQGIAENQGFDMLDLTPFLLEAIHNGESPYFFADTHWNQLGHDIAHQTLANFLSQSTLDKNPDS
jgi:hypothetical protein